MKNKPIAVTKAYLKIVPYYVTKKPSEPSLMTSAISCIDLGPRSFLSSSQSIHVLTPRNTIEKMKAVNEITLEVDCDTKI